MTPRPASDPRAPKYWTHDTTGALASAVRAYLDDCAGMNLRDIALLRAYLRQWIESPVWDDLPGRPAVDRLRFEIAGITTGKDIATWLHSANCFGIDPL